jgi:hypothetical protein
MEADESYSSDEAQPPSCIAPNARDGQDASPVYWLKGLSESFSPYLSRMLSSIRRVSRFFIYLRYSYVREAFIEQGIPMCFTEQSSCTEGGDQK